MRLPLSLWFVVGTAGLFVPAHTAVADQHVSVSSFADPEYTRHKYNGGKTRKETYVFMAGKYFDGVTVDHSIERMPFRRIAEMLAPELARQQYLPTTNLNSADLLLVVHWGTTMPRVTSDEMRGITTISLDNSQEKALRAEINAAMAGGSPGMAVFLSTESTQGGERMAFEQEIRVTDGLDRDLHNASNAQLLGYTRELRRLQANPFPNEEEASLVRDLAVEKYFIIIKAYDLHETIGSGQNRRAVWTMHLSLRSPGNNFPTALNLMGEVAVNYFGRTTDGLKVERPSGHEGTVELGPLTILGEAK